VARGNSFSPVPTTAASFRDSEWLAGDEAAAFYRGAATEGGAAVAFLDANPEWRGVFLRRADSWGRFMGSGLSF
jgi:hypothetical protein